jgi:hypothetical protein
MTLSNYMALKNVRKLHIKVNLGIELYFNFRLETKSNLNKLLNDTHEIYMGNFYIDI